MGPALIGLPIKADADDQMRHRRYAIFQKNTCQQSDQLASLNCRGAATSAVGRVRIADARRAEW